jgi:hypothetical protein
VCDGIGVGGLVTHNAALHFGVHGMCGSDMVLHSLVIELLLR